MSKFSNINILIIFCLNSFNIIIQGEKPSNFSHFSFSFAQKLQRLQRGCLILDRPDRLLKMWFWDAKRLSQRKRNADRALTAFFYRGRKFCRVSCLRDLIHSSINTWPKITRNQPPVHPLGAVNSDSGTLAHVGTAVASAELSCGRTEAFRGRPGEMCLGSGDLPARPRRLAAAA